MYEGAASGNPGALLSLLSPDVNWHFPGESWMGGTYVGPSEVLRLFMVLSHMTDGTFRAEPNDIVGNDDHVVSIVTASATRAGQRFETPVAVVYTFAGDHVVDVREHVFDVAGLDRFWGDARPDGW